MKDIYDVYSYSKDELRTLFHEMEGYNKVKSILLLKLLDFPVLDFVIVTKWSEKTRNGLQNFAGKICSNSFLLRHDKSPEQYSYPRGGYVINYDKLEAECNKFFSLNRLVMLLEPFSPYDNNFNINILYDRDNIIFEILGPGFDASDLQRGDISPHEIFEFINNDEYDKKMRPTVHHIISTHDYQCTVKQRYIKIGKRLIDLGLLSQGDNDSHIIKITKDYLSENNFNLLLRNEKYYTKISMNTIRDIYDYIYNLDIKIKLYYNNICFPFVVSLSMLNKTKKLNFWDIVFADTKYTLPSHAK